MRRARRSAASGACRDALAKAPIFAVQLAQVRQRDRATTATTHPTALTTPQDPDPHPHDQPSTSRCHGRTVPADPGPRPTLKVPGISSVQGGWFPACRGRAMGRMTPRARAPGLSRGEQRLHDPSTAANERLREGHAVPAEDEHQPTHRGPGPHHRQGTAPPRPSTNRGRATADRPERVRVHQPTRTTGTRSHDPGITFDRRRSSLRARPAPRHCG